jgi:ribokinase
MVGQGGENYLGVAPGANYRLARSHVDQAGGLIASAAMLVLQYEITADTLAYAVNLTYAAGRPILLNLAPPRPIGDETLRKLDILVVNETEASFLCGLPVGDEAQAWQAAAALRAKGPKLVILTLGANGLVALGSQERHYVPAFKVEAVDTTAAGDVFCGTLAVAIVEGQPLLHSLRFASAASALSVTRMGAQPSIPSREEIETFLRQAG